MDLHRYDSRRHSRRAKGIWLRRTLGVVTLSLAGLALGSAIVRAQSPAAIPPATSPLVFDGVTVIDVQHGRRLPAQRVVVVGNRIRSVGSAGTVRLPVGARVVDARGQYLIPGLWDMHTHSRTRTEVFYPHACESTLEWGRSAPWLAP